MRWQGPLFAAIVAIPVIFAVVAYPLSDWRREPMNDGARSALLREGKARRFVRTPEGVMHVRISGPAHGPVVLLVHGGSIGGYGFSKWEKPLADAGYRVVVPDLLGYGYSDHPRGRYTREFYTTQIQGLLDGLEIKTPAHIVGASLGGAIVTSYAAEQPERVATVTLVAPAGGGRKPVVSPVLLWPVVGDWAFRVYGATSASGRLAKAYANTPGREGVARWMGEQARYRGYAEGMLNTLRNYDSAWLPDDYRRLGRSGLPVLAVWGTADTVNPFDQSKVIQAWVPQMKLAPLPGMAHSITFGQSQSVLERFIPFLNEHAPRPQAGPATPAPLDNPPG